jgi:hypothetical protein
MINESAKVAEKIRTRAVYRIMWKNMAETGRP